MYNYLNLVGDAISFLSDHTLKLFAKWTPLTVGNEGEVNREEWSLSNLVSVDT